jgi:hypothetical protein
MVLQSAFRVARTHQAFACEIQDMTDEVERRVKARKAPA